MGVINWGLLAKSQTDNETIEEAISRLISAHEADEEAHTGEGESLENHKSSETIDHLNESVGADAIKTRDVLSEKLGNNRYELRFNWGNIDKWTSDIDGAGYVTPYIGSVAIVGGASAGNYTRIYTDCAGQGFGVMFDKNPRFLTSVFLSTSYAGTGYFLCGKIGNLGFGFKVVNKKIYSLVIDDAGEHTVELLSLTSGGFNYRLEAVYTSGEKIEFYIDRVLKTTVTDNLPEDGTNPQLMDQYFDIKALYADSDRFLCYVRDLVISNEN
jgi:hypothetical protein